jgi:glycosyltransferase involved in cell wall biosynthesis
MARVSVIIPTHNRARFLGAAISSVLNQTYTDFELVVVDDGSRDETVEVVGKFHDDRLRLIRHPEPKGGAAARNTGIRNSTAAYVAFLDDDDEWYPEKLRLQVELLDRSPAGTGVIYAGFEKFESGSGRIVERRMPSQRGNLRESLLVANPVAGTSTVLVRRECLEAVGGFDEELTSFQDFDLWLRLSAHCEFDFVPQVLYKYRLHSVQIWTNLDALFKGVERIISKHGQHRGVRRRFAAHCVRLGREYTLAGEPGKARRVLRRAMTLRPANARSYVYYLASYFGMKGFQLLSGAKSQVTARFNKLGNPGGD